MLFPTSVTLDPRWHDVIPSRISRRAYDGRPVPQDLLEQLKGIAEGFRPDPAVRTAIIDDATDDLFKGYVGSYGSVRGAKAVAAFIGPEDAGLAVGYAGEAFILEATRLGLDTCWVAGSFDRDATSGAFALSGDERVLSITPIGFAPARLPFDERAMRAAVRSSSRKPLEVLAPGSEGWPEWAKTAAEAARLAPTGGNGQPQRMRFEGGALVVSSAERTYWTAPIDFGIVMLHAELGALHEGVQGTWERLASPDVARLVPSDRGA